MNESEKKINKLTSDINKALRTMTPQISGVVERIRQVTENMQPKLIKKVTIDNKKAKVILYNDNAIRIEFEDKQYAEKYYTDYGNTL